MEELKNVGDLIDKTSLKIGNQVRSSTGVPAVAALTNLYIDSSSLLQSSVPLQVDQTATITGQVMTVTGTPNGDVMTQTLVGQADATTKTINSFMRVSVVSNNTALVSTSAYYIPLYTLL